MTPGNLQEEIGAEEWQFGRDLEDCGEMKVKVKSEVREEFRSPISVAKVNSYCAS